MKGQEGRLAHKVWAEDITRQWGQQQQRPSWVRLRDRKSQCAWWAGGGGGGSPRRVGLAAPGEGGEQRRPSRQAVPPMVPAATADKRSGWPSVVLAAALRTGRNTASRAPCRVRSPGVGCRALRGRRARSVTPTARDPEEKAGWRCGKGDAGYWCSGSLRPGGGSAAPAHLCSAQPTYTTGFPHSTPGRFFPREHLSDTLSTDKHYFSCTLAASLCSGPRPSPTKLCLE